MLKDVYTRSILNINQIKLFYSTSRRLRNYTISCTQSDHQEPPPPPHHHPGPATTPGQVAARVLTGQVRSRWTRYGQGSRKGTVSHTPGTSSSKKKGKCRTESLRGRSSSTLTVCAIFRSSSPPPPPQAPVPVPLPPTPLCHPKRSHPAPSHPFLLAGGVAREVAFVL